MGEQRTDSPQLAPQGLYKIAVRHGDLIFTAGMTPRKHGALQLEGPVARDSAVADYKEVAALACTNALTAARAMLREVEVLSAVISMTVYVAAEPGFGEHSRIADFASEVLKAEFGEQGVGVRAAVGVGSLPGNAPIEIQLIALAGAARDHVL